MIKILIFLQSLMALEFEQTLVKLSQLEPQEYAIKINNFERYFQSELDRKTFLCEGEVSIAEKSKCRNQLKDLKFNYLKTMFSARKKYLNFLHENRMKELEQERLQLLKSLN